jgi:WD40 repeat protein
MLRVIRLVSTLPIVIVTSFLLFPSSRANAVDAGRARLVEHVGRSQPIARSDELHGVSARSKHAQVNSPPKKSGPAPKRATSSKSPVTVVPNIGNLWGTDRAVISPDGQLLATVGSGAIKLWDIASGRPLRTMEYQAFFLAVTFSPDGTTIASGHKDGSIKLWDVATGTGTTLEAPPKPGRDQDQADFAVQSLEFDAKGAFLATGSKIGVITIWNMATRKPASRFNFQGGGVVAVRISPDGSKLTAVSRDTVRLFDVRTKAAITSFKLPKNHSFAEDSIADNEKFVVRVASANCRIEHLSFLDLKNRTQFVPIDRSGRCNPPDDNPDFDEPITFSNGDRTKLLVARRGTPEFKLWDLRTGRVDRTLRWTNVGSEKVIGVSSDLSRAVTTDKWVRIREVESGAVVRDLIPYGSPAENAIASGDGRHIFLSHPNANDDQKVIDVWQVNTVSPRTFRLATPRKTIISDFAPEANLALGVNDNKIVLLSTETGREFRTLAVPEITEIESARISPSGRLIAVVGQSSESKTVALLIDAAGGTVKLTLRNRTQDDTDSVSSVAFSADDKRLAVGRWDGSAEVWSTEPIQQIKSLPPDPTDAWDQTRSLVFSDDGQLLIGGSRDSGVFMWNVATGRWIRTLGRDSLAGHVNVSSVAVSHDGKLVVGGLAERARSSGDIGAERGIKVWEADTGKLLFTLRGHEGGVRAVTFSPDDRWIVSASYDGSIRYWDRTSGKWLATFTAAQDGRWLMVTESGFFAGSSNTDDLVGVVRGLVPYSVSQFRDHLYRPDLVEELLKGDPEGKYADATSKLNLQTILDSGPAPQIELLEKRTEQSGDTVRLSVRITDAGGGIGSKVVWRVNGKTQGDLTTANLRGPPNPGRPVVMTQGLRVDAGQSNTVEVTAYNGTDLLASLPLKMTVDPFGVTTQERPRLHVLAIGVEKYAMKEYELLYAVKDAKDFGDALKIVGSSLFSEVKVTPLYDAEVTRRGIETAINKLANEVRPTDVFVLFLGGHGRSIAGKYYFLQQDLDFSKGQSIERDGISQDLWQAWLAKIPAQKTLLVFDTCESAAATGLVRGGERERQTAMEQLQNATGNNLIAAARQAALEGYRGHGVLTYTVLSAFHKPQTGTSDDRVDVDGLALYVGQQVPEITKSLYGVAQEPIRKLAGSNFPLGLRVMEAPQPSDCPDKQEFVVNRKERLREAPEDQAGGDRMLDAGYAVGVKFVGKWALLCRDGVKIGYVPEEAVFKVR